MTEMEVTAAIISEAMYNGLENAKNTKHKRL